METYENEKAIVENVRRKVDDLNDLFEQSASYNIQFSFNFVQNKSIGKGPVGYLTFKAYKSF